MIRYIPFLKAKQGELNAMSELAPKVKEAICPLFDFPRPKADYDSAAYADTANRIAASLKKHWREEAEFYFDDRDIGQKLKVEGAEKYAYVLGALHELNVIPVVGLSRTGHNGSVARLKRNGEIGSAIVAFRIEKTNFQDFDVIKDQLEYELDDVFKEFDAIDLILDCRLCSGFDVSETGLEIAAFAKKFCAGYDKVRRVIVTGSSIPPSIGDVLDVDETEHLPRRELAIIGKARDLSDVDIVPGDYASVSPFYSDADIDERLMQTVMTARLIYPFKGFHYFIRGGSMKTRGAKQYFALAKELCGNGFFRGPTYSSGDFYLHEKSKSLGKNATNGAVVKPSVVAHITYMVLGAKA
ncbi:MAG: hypothetical protein ABIR80_00900 [Opitutaceae bacterium]